MKFSQDGLCSILGGKKQQGRWWLGGCARGLWKCAPGTRGLRQEWHFSLGNSDEEIEWPKPWTP